MLEKNTLHQRNNLQKNSLSQEEMSLNIGSCYVVKRSYKRSDLPIYRELHRIVGVMGKEGVLIYVSDIISIEDKKSYISIVNSRRVEVAVAVYSDNDTTLINEKNYLEIVKYYQVTMKSMFRNMDMIITEQLVKAKRIKAIVNGTLT